MKRLSKLVLVSVIVSIFAFSTVVWAEESNNDFSLSDTTYSQDELDTLKLSHKEKAESYKKGLNACYDFKYNTNVEETVETFDTETVERAAEKEAVVSEKEEEGYSVVVVEKTHDATIEEYAFNVLNGIVRSATKDNSEVTNYDGMDSEEVINSEFTDYEDDDTKIVNKVTVNTEVISESETRATRLSANSYAAELRSDGFTATVTQNNTERTNFEIISRNALWSFQVTPRANTMAANANPGKEILDLRLNLVINARVQKEEEFTTRDEAEARANELRNSGSYESVRTSVEIDDTDPTKVVDKEETEWTAPNLDPYTEDVYTDNDITGYRYFYNEEVVEEEADSVNINNLSSRRCNQYLNSDEYANWTDKACTRQSNNPFSQAYNLFTFTANKPAVTRTQGYYDEYQFDVKYIVRYSYYSYTGSYIATDYTVSYNGTRSNINVVKEIYDKYYEIDGTRTRYDVETTGTKTNNGSCVVSETDDSTKTINTGVKENTSYEMVLVVSISLLATTFMFRKRFN